MSAITAGLIAVGYRSERDRHIANLARETVARRVEEARRMLADGEAPIVPVRAIATAATDAMRHAAALDAVLKLAFMLPEEKNGDSR